jgi:hypothetical protein
MLSVAQIRGRRWRYKCGRVDRRLRLVFEFRKFSKDFHIFLEHVRVASASMLVIIRKVLNGSLHCHVY